MLKHLLGDKFFNDVYFSTSVTRPRSNTIPSRSSCILKKSSIKVKQNNKNEASWETIDPNSKVANILSTTRDIAGFLCATADNMGKTDLINSIMEDLLASYGRNIKQSRRPFKTARRKLPCK